MATLTLASLVIKVVSDAKEYQKGLKAAEQDTEGFRKSVDKNVNRAIALGYAAAAAAVTKFAADSIKAFNNFEEQTAEVFTLMPGMTKQAMDSMRTDILEFSKDTGRLTDEVVPALYQAISAGVPKENVFDFLEQAEQAAEGGVIDLTTAVDGLTSVVNAYGAEVISAAEASDIMFTGVRLGKTTFGELSDSLSNVTPLAAALGVSFGDVTAALAAMTSQGTPTAQAVVQLRGLLQDLSKEGTVVSGIFQEAAGVGFAEFIGQGHSLADVLQILEEQSAATGIPIQDMFGNIRGGLGALQLTGQGMDKFVENLQAMEESAGATAEAAELMGSVVADSLDEAAAASESLKIRFGEMMQFVVAGAAEGQKSTFTFLESQLRWVSANNLVKASVDDLSLSTEDQVRIMEIAEDTGSAFFDKLYEGERQFTRASIALDLLEQGFEGTYEELARQVDILEITHGQLDRLSDEIDAAAAADWRWVEAADEATTSTEDQAGAVEELFVVTSDYLATTKEAILNQEILNEDVIAAAVAAGATAEQVAILQGAMGSWSDEMVEAALQAAIVTAKVDELAQQYVAGEITADEMRLAVQQLRSELDAIQGDYQANLNIEVEGLGRLREAIDLFGEYYDLGGGGRPPSTDLHPPPGPPPEDVGNLPEFEHGGSFVVPPGFNDDNFLVGLSSHETMTVWPEGMTGGVQYLFQIDARGAAPGVEEAIERAVERALESRGAYAYYVSRRGF